MPEKEQLPSQDPEVREKGAAGEERRLTKQEQLLADIFAVTPPPPEKTISLSELREQFADKLGRPSRWYLRDIKTIKGFWRRR